MNIEQIEQAKHDLFYIDGTFRLKDIHAHTQTIQFALRLAHKVMSEPSEGMLKAGKREMRRLPYTSESYKSIAKKTYKAMINDAIEELEPVNKTPKS